MEPKGGCRGGRSSAPSLEAANLLAERCGVSNTQQWAGNIRYIIGWGEHLAGASPEAPPPPGCPGYPSGSGRWEGLWKLLLTLPRLVYPGNAGRQDTLANGSPPDCTLDVPQSLGDPGCARNPSVAKVKLQFPPQMPVGARVCTGCSYSLVSECTVGVLAAHKYWVFPS